MTTITYTDDVMAFDSQVTYADHIIVGTCDHKGKKINGMLIGAAGDYEACEFIFAWAKKDFKEEHKPTLPLDPTINSIIVKPNGKVYRMDGGLVLYHLKADYVAVGSGEQLALGAMAQGATAVEAVKIASKYDVYTGGKIRQIKL